MKMKGFVCLVVGLTGWYGILSPARATVYFDDGKEHTIGEVISDEVEVRADAFFGGDTSVRVVLGGSVHALLAYDGSQIEVDGGEILGNLYAFESTQMAVSGGEIGHSLAALGESQVTLSGGVVAHYFDARGDSKVVVMGGEIGRALNAEEGCHVEISGAAMLGDLIARDTSEVTVWGGTIRTALHVGSSAQGDDTCVVRLHGSGFAINGTSVPYGEYDTGGSDSVHGSLSGTLAEGDELDIDLFIYDEARLVLVPEPATFALLALGALAVLRQMRRR